MADGVTHLKYHDRLWIVAIIVMAIIGYILYSMGINPIEYIVLYMIFYGIGEYFISPDLDLLSVTGQDGRALTLIKSNVILGCLLGLPFAMWSLIYSWFMQLLGGHRNPWSHGIIIGTLGRMLWFNLPLTLVGIVVSLIMQWPRGTWGYNLYLDLWFPSYIYAQFTAWFMSDLWHIILDTQWAKGILYTPEIIRK